MTRGVRKSLVGSLVLVALAGCGRLWFAEREPWRREAEVACLKSGAVKVGPTVALLRPIEGPGICGADFPLKVTALGETSPFAYVDEPVRPPGAIPSSGFLNGYPRAIVAPAASAPMSGANAPYGLAPYSPPPYSPPPATSAPIALTPPATAPAVAPQSVPLGPASTPLTMASIPASVMPAATLACPVVSALDRWVTESVQPAAVRWFGEQVVAIKQISSYSCRGMNGQPGAHISEHAFGNALDIAAFTLADGRQITVREGWHGRPEEQGFLHDVQLAACEQFTTVLAPGSNVYHYNHIHVDLMRRASGRRICEPNPIGGDAVAARARARYGSRADPGITGSIPERRGAVRRSSWASAYGEEGGRRLPDAVPGED